MQCCSRQSICIEDTIILPNTNCPFLSVSMKESSCHVHGNVVVNEYAPRDTSKSSGKSKIKRKEWHMPNRVAQSFYVDFTCSLDCDNE